jgi:hypothetical protein
VVLAAVNRNGSALSYASDDLKNDRDVVLAAVEQNGRALYSASADLKNDRDVVLAAVNQDGTALMCASADLKNDRGVVMAALKNSIEVLKLYVGDDVFTHTVCEGGGNVPDFIINALKNTEQGQRCLHQMVNDTSMKRKLYTLVRSDPAIADVKDKKGRRAIDVAITGGCKEAMESALRLFGTFQVDAGPVLHESETSVVFKVTKYDEQSDDKDNKAGEVGVPTALKCMRDFDQVRKVLPFEELRFLVSNNPVIFHNRNNFIEFSLLFYFHYVENNMVLAALCYWSG